MNVKSLTALQLASLIRSGEITCTDAVHSLYDLAKNDEYNCYTSLDIDAALSAAQRVQKNIDSGVFNSALAGVPVAIKDNICEKGKVTSCASGMLKNFVPPYDATVIDRLKAADMIPLFKTNMDEFAMGSSSENSIYGAVKNPHNTTKSAGGSSGGSAAAVASGSSVIALGSDTGGSIRLPASNCGVVGLKPTYGAVPRYGLIAYASSFDTIGTLSKNVSDSAALFGIIKGEDSHDATTCKSPDFTLEGIKTRDLAGVKIGMPVDLYDSADEDVKSAAFDFANTFKSLGAQVEEFYFDMLRFAAPTYYIIACAEACSNLARYDGVRYGYADSSAETVDDLFVNSRSKGFSFEVKKRIMLGNFVLSEGYFDEYYKKALGAKVMICDAFEEAFGRYDIILSPVSPSGAQPLFDGNVLQKYKDDAFCVLANIAGLPALSVPCGQDKNGMPVGAQLIGRALDEESLLKVGYAYEQLQEGAYGV